MIKLFSILLGFSFGLSVYAFIGYMFTKRISIGRKYRLKFFIFSILFVLILVLYIYLR
ncbi:MAG: hypothetical protein NC921_00740 [Candidatus Omnitrophica bacterium]|nr:hypothetical protein [Candidatus Omnitrophota bacterium]MCM8809233.1 hypothetical protein [Candidatus Omnitrophota bacterium]MCM8810509.1 hypothetical protein [Candidatus Omnitrophota bacterium]